MTLDEEPVPTKRTYIEHPLWRKRLLLTLLLPVCLQDFGSVDRVETLGGSPELLQTANEEISLSLPSTFQTSNKNWPQYALVYLIILQCTDQANQLAHLLILRGDLVGKYVEHTPPIYESTEFPRLGQDAKIFQIPRRRFWSREL